jgi:GAF domain-containing protein
VRSRPQTEADPIRDALRVKRFVQAGTYGAIIASLPLYHFALAYSAPQLLAVLFIGLSIATAAIEGAFWQIFKLRRQSAYPHLIAVELGTVQDLREACQIAVSAATRWLRADGAVLVWIRRFGTFLPVATCGMPSGWNLQSPPISIDPPLLRSVQSGQIVVESTSGSPTWSYLFAEPHRIAYVPLLARDKVIGVLCLVGRKNNVELADHKLLQSIGLVIGLSLENMRLNSEQYESIMEVLCSALDMRDSATHGHSQRVATLARLTAKQLDLPPTDIRTIEQAAVLHDIGKIGVADSILHKSGPLSDLEWDELRRHPSLGFQILRDVSGMAEAAEIVFSHHERFDGNGYPRGLSNQSIPLGARVFAVVDTYDAITSDRPYRQARSHEEAVAEIARHAGSQFDPIVVAAFLDMVREGLLETRDEATARTTLGTAPGVPVALRTN